MTGDFPSLDTGHFAAEKLWLWIEKGSTYSFESLSRYPVIGLWYILSFLSLDSAIITKSIVILGFLLASTSFYFSFLFLFKKKFSPYDSIRLKSSALMGAFFYAYNIWSFLRIAHWYLWIGYAVLPFYIVSVICLVKNPKRLKYIVSSVLLWSFASTTPHLTVFYGIILIVIFFLFFLFNHKKKFTQLAPSILSVILLYSLVNMYWIYPYLVASRSSPVPIGPMYLLQEENLQILSRHANILNSFRLASDWQSVQHHEPSENAPLHTLWIFASFLIPIIAFSSLITRKFMIYTSIFSFVAIIGILLDMGTQSPINYYNIIFSTEIGKNYGWLIRAPEKFTLLIAFGYSFLISITTIKLLNWARNEKKLFGIAFLILLIGSMVVYSYPIYKFTMDEKFNRITIPDDFNKLNDYLSKINEDKVFFMPYPSGESEWSRNEVMDIYQLYSLKPSIGITSPALKNYYNFFVKSLMANTSGDIDNFISPLGSSYLIFHNDTRSKVNFGGKSLFKDNLDLLNRLYKSPGIKFVDKIGLFNIFKTNSSVSVGELNIPKNNIIVVGGLDNLLFLNSVDSLKPKDASLLFLDQTMSKMKNNAVKTDDPLIMGRSASNLILGFADNKFILSPFDKTFNHDPDRMWSRESTASPELGIFHNYLTDLGIENWDFDYGKGVVITKEKDKLDMDIKVKDNDHYDLFVRYLENQKGGIMNIYLDGSLVNEINSKDYERNTFVWAKITNQYLTKGTHTITLENVVGLNVVNIFAILPTNETSKLIKNGISIAEKTKNIFLLKASDFSNIHNTNEYTNSLLNTNNFSDTIGIKGSVNRTISGQFRAPENTDRVSLQFWATQNPQSNSSYVIRNLEINPAFTKHNIFEMNNHTGSGMSIAEVRNMDWRILNKNILSRSFEIMNSSSEETGMRIDIKQGNNTKGVITTNFIPINEESYYDYIINVTGKDVNQFYSRVLYFDSNKKPLSKEIAFPAVAGSFKNTFNTSILPPIGTKYLKLELSVLANRWTNSNYLVNDLELQQIHPITIFKNNMKVFENSNASNQKIVLIPATSASNSGGDKNFMLKAEINRGSLDGFNLLQTKQLPIEGNMVYNYSLTVETNNITSLYSVTSFGKNDDFENIRKYELNGTIHNVFDVRPGSVLYTDFDVLKSSNYVVAMKVRTCQTCTFLNVTLGDNKYKISLKDKNSQLKWLYLNDTYLDQGSSELRIYSDTEAYLDSVVIYSINKSSTSTVPETIEKSMKDLFLSEPPARIVSYTKVNPTKYIVNIMNATRPYVLVLAESFDPLWLASVQGAYNSADRIPFRTNSIPIYSITNGFLINKTGNYTLTIEYQPQEWFNDGKTITLLTLAILSIYFIVWNKTCISAMKKVLKKSHFLRSV